MFTPPMWWSLGLAATLAIAGLTYVLWPGSSPAVVTETPAAPAEDSPPPNQTSSRMPRQRRLMLRLTNPRSWRRPRPATWQPMSPYPPAAESVATDEQPLPTPTPVETTPPHEAAPPTPEDRPDAATVASSSGADKHVLKFDPLDFDPEHLSLGTTNSKPAANPVVPPTVSIQPAAAAETVPPNPEGGEKNPPPGDLLPPVDANQPIKSHRGPVADDPSPVDAAERLAMKVKSLRLAEMPLGRFAEILSSMSGVPITLDPITLELNGISPRDLVSVDVTDTSLEKILADALVRHRFELVAQHANAHVAIPKAAEKRSVDFDVKDLVQGGDAVPLTTLIEQFVAPTTWKAAGGKGSIQAEGAVLHVDQSLLVRREGLIFCERLRLARGLPLRSKYPAAMLTVESPYEKLSATLDKPVTFTFMPWTRLADVVRQLQELTGLTILVDWAALGEAQFTPSSTVACSAIDRPWSESLDGILNPLGLTWWAVDAKTLQITTLDALERIERVEFYPIAPKLREQIPKDDALIAALQDAIGKRPGDHADADECHLAVDVPSGRLIARASPAIQRFLHSRLHDSTEPLAKHD